MADKAVMMDGVWVKVVDLDETVVVGSTIHEGTYTDVTEAVFALATSIANAALTMTHTAVNATIASGTVLAANANRQYAYLINNSDTVIYLAFGVTAVANQGIRLNANGGSYEIGAAAHGNLYQGAILAIHGGAGNKVLLMTEGVP